MALTDLTRISTSGIATGTSLSGAILHGDAHFRGTQVGVTSALFDSSDDALEFSDNVKLTFGDSSDLLLYHTGGNSIVRDQGTGTLSLQSNGTEIALYNYANSQYMGKFANAAQVELYYAGDPKFQTTSTGAIVTGILTATSFSGPLVGNTNNTSGLSTFYDLRVSNNLTVEGTTTTLDTNLIGVDRVEVGANSNTLAGIAVTQSGTADIVRLFDGSTQVVTVDDTGNVGIGSAIPSQKLDVNGTVKATTFSGSGASLTSIANANISNSAAIAGSKITPNFGSQTLTAGLVYAGGLNSSGGLSLSGGTVQINFNRTSHSPTYRMVLTGGSNPTMNFRIRDTTNSLDRFMIRHGGQIEIPGDVGIGHTVNFSATNISKFGSFSTLHIKGPSNEGAAIRLQDNSDTADSDDFVIYKNNVGGYLRVNGTDPLIAFLNGSEKVRIDNNGRVGIGTDSPSKKLHVDGTIFASGATTSLDGGLRIQPNNDGTNYGGVIYGGAHNDNNTAIYMRRGADGGNNTIDMNSYGMFRVFTNGALASQDERLRIDSTGHTTIYSGTHDKGLDILPTANSRETRLRIQGKASNGTEHTFTFAAKASSNSLNMSGTGPMCFIGSQNVGVQNATPDSPLQVGGGTSPHTNKATVHIAPSSGNASLCLRGGNPTIFFDKTGSPANSKILLDNVPLAIYSGTLDSEGSELLRMDSNGRVMIGNTNASTMFGGADDLVVGNTSGAHGITIITQNNSVGRLLFSDSTSSGAATYQGQINYNHSNDRLDLRTYTAGTITLSTSNTERIFLQSDGRFVIGNTTGTQPSATVGGAQFYGGSYPGDFRISSGAGASGTTTASIAIMGSNYNASIENGANSGSQLNLYNYNTTNGNSSAVSFLNKNGLSSARILGLNIDHDNRDGALVFMVADGSHPTEAARIIQNKNIGIQASTNVNNRL